MVGVEDLEDVVDTVVACVVIVVLVDCSLFFEVVELALLGSFVDDVCDLGDDDEDVSACGCCCCTKYKVLLVGSVLTFVSSLSGGGCCEG